MKSKVTLYLVYLSVLGMLLSSCGSVKDLEFRSFNNVKIEKVGFASSTLSVDLVYYNPNNFGLELSRTDLDIYLNDNFLGHSTQVMQVKLPRRDQFTLPIKVDLDMKNLLKNSLTSIFNSEVTIKAVGKIKVGKAGVYKLLPFEYVTKQKLSLF